MALTTLTLKEWRERFRGTIRSLITNASTARGEDYEITSRMMAVLAHAAQGAALYVIRQIFPTTADGEMVDRHLAERRLGYLPAAKAIGKIAIKAASAGQTQVSGSALLATDATAYATTALATAATPGWSGKTVGAGTTRTRIVVLPNTTGMSALDRFAVNNEERVIREVLSGIGAIDLYEPLLVVPANGLAISPQTGVVVGVLASLAGAKGNRDVGETLTLAAPGVGITGATKVLELSGGGDLETPAEARARMQDFDAGRPSAGNDEFWRDVARRTEGVRLADAFVFPGFRGLGTVDVIPFGVSGARVIGADTVAKVQAAIDAVRGYQDDVLVKVAGSGPEVAITLVVHVHPDWRPDFSEDAVVTTHNSTACTTTRINTLTSPIASGIEIGDRVLIPVLVGARWKLQQRTVSTVTSTYFEVSTPFDAIPGTLQEVRPGGPLGEDVIAAVESVFDNLGPAVFKSIVGIQYDLYMQRTPSPAVLYDGTLRANRIIEAVIGLEGAGECEMVSFNGDSSAPFADVNPNPQAIAYLGKLTVRWNTLGV